MFKPFNQSTLAEMGFTVRDFDIKGKHGYQGKKPSNKYANIPISR